MKQYKTNAFLKEMIDRNLKKAFKPKKYIKNNGRTDVYRPLKYTFVTARGKNKLSRRFAMANLKAELRKKQMKAIAGSHDITSPKCIFRQAIYQNRG